MDGVCLIIPPSPFLADERVFVSLGILKVAACLEQAGYPVDVLDLSGIRNYEDVINDYIDHNRSINYFGITVTTPQCPAGETITNRIREATGEKRRVIWGGPHVTVVNAARKLEVKKGIIGRGHKAFARIANIADVLVAGDGEEAIFAAIQPEAPQLIDADDPSSSFFLSSSKKGDLLFPTEVLIETRKAGGRVQDATLRLEEMPFSARHLIDLDSYHYYIDGQRATSLIMQLGCPFACVAEEMMLGTADGLFRPGEVIFDEVKVCPVGHLHNLGYKEHFTIVSNGQKECICIKFANGLDLMVTSDHPILCVSKERLIWKEAGSLSVGDYIAFEAGQNQVKGYVKLSPPPFPKKHSGFQWKEKKVGIPALLDEKVAWLVGLLISDGSLPGDNRPSIHFAVKSRSEERATQYIQDCFGITGALSTHTLTTKMKNLWVHSRRVRDFFTESIGIDPKYKLAVPKVIRQSPKEVVKAFLDGLWAGDGYSPKTSPHTHSYLATVSEPFAKEVAQLAIWCGYGASVVRGSRSKGTNKYSWRVVLCLEECWADKNGRPCLTSSIPINPRRIYRSRKSGKLFWRTSNDGNQRGVARVLLKEIDPFHQLVQGSFIYVPVKEIREGGYRNVYDLSIPYVHRFTASGVALHNCRFCSGRLSPSFRRTRIRDIDSVLKEIESIYKNYGYLGLMMYDDELNVNPNMIRDMYAIAELQNKLGVDFRLRGFIKADLFTEAQARAMKEAGFKEMCVGFESGAPRILKNIKKQATVEQNTRCLEIAKKYGLRVKAFTSIGHPGESAKTIEQTHDWLIRSEINDFDTTIISTFPGTPYYDEAIPTEQRNIWVYTTPETGDKLYAQDIDYVMVAEYYKGQIDDGYRAYVHTDFLSSQELIQLRDWVERDVRSKLGIPFYNITPATKYDASMGQLPGHIYRRTNAGAHLEPGNGSVRYSNNPTSRR